MLGFCPKSIIVFGIAFAGVPYIYSCRDTDAQNLSEDIRVVYRPAVKLPDAINVDIFWCSDDDSARTRQIAAAELAGSYATIAKVSLPISKTGSVGEIRTRPIRRDIYYNKVGKVSTDLGGQDATAVFDDHDDKLNSVSGIFATQGLRSLKIAKVPDDIYAPNYISVYVCSDVDTSGLLGRLYFQVKDVSQKETAADAAATIRKSLPGVSIANSIEVVGSRAPDKSELRYFYDNDKNAAENVAAQISQSIGATMLPRQISGFEGKVRPGTFEAWIGQ
jgi:hypothetical protein